MRIKRAIQIGDNVTNIIRLPCCYSCIKESDKNGLSWLMFSFKCGESGRTMLGEKGDWVIEDENGHWNIMSDDTYQKYKTMDISQPPKKELTRIKKQ